MTITNLEATNSHNLTSYNKIVFSDIRLIFGGSFDPIHLGHIQTAEQTANWLNVEKVTLIPSHIPPHKSQLHASSHHRQRMLELVCQQRPRFQLDSRELHKNSPSYTVETLHEIKREQPKSPLVFMMGLDSLLTFTSWYQWQEILSLTNIVVNVRPKHSLDYIARELRVHLVNHLNDFRQHKTGKIIIHRGETYDISSTMIRNAIAKKNSVTQYLCPDVHQYILKEQLY